MELKHCGPTYKAKKADIFELTRKGYATPWSSVVSQEFRGGKVLTPCRAFETSVACRTRSNRLLVKKAGVLDQWLGVCQADAG